MINRQKSPRFRERPSTHIIGRKTNCCDWLNVISHRISKSPSHMVDRATSEPIFLASNLHLYSISRTDNHSEGFSLIACCFIAKFQTLIHSFLCSLPTCLQNVWMFRMLLLLGGDRGGVLDVSFWRGFLYRLFVVFRGLLFSFHLDATKDARSLELVCLPQCVSDIVDACFFTVKVHTTTMGRNPVV
jgi:hypothetical protein